MTDQRNDFSEVWFDEAMSLTVIQQRGFGSVGWGWDLQECG